MNMQILVPGIGRPYVAGEPVDFSAPLAFTVPRVMSLAECAEQIARIDRLGPAPAPITTAHGFVMRPELRNNTRVMFDDPALAAELFGRLLPSLPSPLFGRRPVGVNERFRCYRYEPGQRFGPHYDGAFCRDDREASELTLLVYLNDDFVGGETAFLQHGLVVAPVRGHALLFQHHQLHEGRAVDAGCKYVLRSDVMYADG